MYAALWEAYRIEYQMSSGGPGSGLFKSTDGGETWTEITRNPGLPSGVVGRIGVAVTRRRFQPRLRAGRERERRPVRVRRRRRDVEADQRRPQHPPARVLLHARLRRPEQQGRRLHAEHGAVPLDRRRQDARRRSARARTAIITTCGSIRTIRSTSSMATTAAARSPTTSASRVPNWSDQDFPTAQFYHVITTTHLPFHVCGSQQDNSTLCVPSNTNAPGGGFGGNPPVAPYQAGGGEPGYIAPHPTDPDIFFAGTNNGSFLTRLNRRTGELKEVGAVSALLLRRAVEGRQGALAVDLPDHLLATSIRTCSTPARSACGRRPTAARRGSAISGDLTRHDPKTMEDSGGPITHDMNSPEIYGTVFSLGARQEGRQHHLGGLGRRPRARHARRRQDLDERDAEGHARLRPRQPDRRLVVRRRHRVRGGEEDAARRPLAVHLPHQRLRQDLDEDRQRHSRRTTTCTRCARIRRAAACSTPARSTASTSRSTTATSWQTFSKACPTCR